MDDEYEESDAIETEVYKDSVIKYHTFANSAETAYTYYIDGHACFLPLDTLADAKQDAYWVIDTGGKVSQADVEAAVQVQKQKLHPQ